MKSTDFVCTINGHCHYKTESDGVIMKLIYNRYYT